MSQTVQKLIAILENPLGPTDVRVAAAKGLGRSNMEAAGEALAKTADNPFSPAELRKVAAEEAGRAIGGKKRRRC